MDEALSEWYAARQAEEIAAQFEGDDTEDRAERESWRQVRRAATGRRLERGEA